jgi:hypothetical protein
MADEADRAQAQTEAFEEQAVARCIGYEIPAGKAGDCDLCGEWSGRLIKGICAPCRDRLLKQGVKIE